jgi:hypothetical protein
MRMIATTTAGGWSPNHVPAGAAGGVASAVPRELGVDVAVAAGLAGLSSPPVGLGPGVAAAALGGGADAPPGLGDAGGTTAVVKFAQRYSRVVTPEA